NTGFMKSRPGCRIRKVANDYPLEVHDSGLRRNAMKYLCIVYTEEAKLAALSDHEFEQLDADSLAYDKEMREGGDFLAAQALQSVQTATTLRVRKNKLSATDGPFAETKEQLCGFVLIQAKDLNEAIRVASKIPSARVGSVEVRPVRELADKEPWDKRA